MDTATWGFIGTITGAIVGASVSILTTLLSGRNSFRLQKEAEKLNRIERAREFQRNNLLELQDLLQKHMRLVARAHLEDLEFYHKSGGGEHYNVLSDELNQELFTTGRDLAMLTERIADDELRDNLKNLQKMITDVLVLARSYAQSKEMMKDASSRYDQFMEQLGIVLRSNY